MGEDRSYIEDNARELARLRGLVERLGESELRRSASEDWTVAGVLGHIAFWDGRAFVLGQKLSGGVPFTPDDQEPDDVDWINDAMSRFSHAMPPLEVARAALRQAQDTDELMAKLPPDRVYPGDPDSSLSADRASHRAEHLDQIEAALGT